MCHSVIAWPFISLIYLAYPRLVSRTNKLVRLSGFPEEKYDTLEYSKVKCYIGDSVRLRNIYSIGLKKCQQKHPMNLMSRASGRFPSTTRCNKP